MRKRLPSIVLCLLVAFTLLFSLSFTAIKVEHECEGEPCHVCKCIDQCIDLIKVSAFAIATVFAVFFIRSYASEIVIISKQFPPELTLVDLKVRLDN